MLIVCENTVSGFDDVFGTARGRGDAYLSEDAILKAGIGPGQSGDAAEFWDELKGSILAGDFESALPHYQWCADREGDGYESSARIIMRAIVSQHLESRWGLLDDFINSLWRCMQTATTADRPEHLVERIHERVISAHTIDIAKQLKENPGSKLSRLLPKYSVARFLGDEVDFETIDSIEYKESMSVMYQAVIDNERDYFEVYDLRGHIGGNNQDEWKSILHELWVTYYNSAVLRKGKPKPFPHHQVKGVVVRNLRIAQQAADDAADAKRRARSYEL